MSSGSEKRFGGTVFRHVSPEHTGLDEAALAGSRQVGGRFNPAGEFGALYFSLERDTAIAELIRRAERAGIDPGELLPRVLLVVQAELQSVLDLRDPDVRTGWGLSDVDLVSDDYRPCQDVARAARRAGYEAILFPSVADQQGRNLAVFSDRLRPGSSLEVIETIPFPLED